MTARRAVPIFFLLGFGLGGGAFGRTFDRPYGEVESALLLRLDFAGKDPSAGPAVAWIADRELAECLDLSTYVRVTQYEAGERMQLRMEERYDIGAVGGRSLVVELRRIDDHRTQVTADYVDRALGFFLIPFAYINPGWVRQGRIDACLARLEGAPNRANRFSPPPPRLPEQACERTQGLSCGPVGAVLPCDTASDNRLQCTCRGRWDCR